MVFQTYPNRLVCPCPACSQRLSLPAGRAGRVRCPGCGHFVHIDTTSPAKLACAICGQPWTKGGVLLDGSAFHEACYADLIAQATRWRAEIDAARTGERSARQALAARPGLVGGLIGLLSSAHRRNAGEKNKALLVEATRLATKAAAAEGKLAGHEARLRRVYDVWPTYPPDWERRKEAVRSRDGDRCATCGEKGIVLHLHHMRPIRHGGSHRDDNLVLLCEDCHSGSHGGKNFHYRDDARPGPTAVEKRVARINRALATGRDLSFRYVKFNRETSKRVVTPRELRKLMPEEMRGLADGPSVSMEREGTLCLFGHCHLRNASRTFAIHRIRSLRIL